MKLKRKNDRGGEKVTWSGGDAGSSGRGRGGGVGGGCSLSFSPVSFVSLLSRPLLCLSLFPLSDLLLFFLFSSAGVGSVDGGRMAVAATGKPDDCGCASSPRCSDTNVCVFLFWSQFSLSTFSSLLLLPFLPLFFRASFLFFFFCLSLLVVAFVSL